MPETTGAPGGPADESQFREMEEQERAIVEALLTVDFPGRDELKQQLDGALVRTVDSDGSFKFRTQGGPVAPVVSPVPVEAKAPDIDGVHVNFLLRVEDGRIDELEIFRDDGRTIQVLPGPSSFDWVWVGVPLPSSKPPPDRS